MNFLYLAASKKSMRFIVTTSLLCASVASWMVTLAQADTPKWTLPKALTDANCVVKFEVDSTWHMIHGSTKEISGEISIEDPNDSHSLHGELRFPVARFDTDNTSRDEKLREIMAADKFPDVVFEFSALEGECDPVRASGAEGCAGVLVGALSIRGLTREARVPIQITPSDSTLKVSGEFPFKWNDFGVEDPSIFVAKLDPVVKVLFQVTLPEQHATGSP